MSLIAMRTLRRWTETVRQLAWGSPRTTFIVYPLTALTIETVRKRRMPAIKTRALPLLAWGYLQYRLCRLYRVSEGAGRQNMRQPPERLVTSGPYALTRNPMYLGHLIYSVGVMLALPSPITALLAAARVLYFSLRVQHDEPQIEAKFGDAYRAYKARVKRWLPGLF